MEIYYLTDGIYVLEDNYILQEDEQSSHYNAETKIKLRAFPNIEMTLKDIFDGID